MMETLLETLIICMTFLNEACDTIETYYDT